MKCPKCGSATIVKERIMGADTMDKLCADCKYVGPKFEFIDSESSDKAKDVQHD